jgi:glyoxylase-like metal-dependent hydrolase (beta-lactamase superfamily II)
VFVEGDNVSFRAMWRCAPCPAFASSKASAKQWVASLDKLAAMKPAIVVPSHGPIGDSGYISAYRTYITRIQGRAAALKKEGKTADQAVEAITAELKADYPDTARAAGAIRAAFNEAP